MSIEEEMKGKFQTLSNRVKNLERTRSPSQSNTQKNMGAVPVTWGSWIITSLILTAWLLVIFPKLQSGMEIGQTIFGVLLVTFMSYFTYRLVMWFIGILMGRSLSLLALLPSSLLGWLALFLALTVLSLVWGQYGPSTSQINDYLSNFWNRASEVLPIGYLSKLNQQSGTDSSTTEPKLSSETGNTGNVLSTLDAELDHIALRYSLSKLYHVQEQDGVVYRVDDFGVLQKQNQILKCWNKFPTLEPVNCNPKLPCRTGNRPVEPYKGRNIKSCPYEFTNGLSGVFTPSVDVNAIRAGDTLSPNEIRQRLAAVFPGLHIAVGPNPPLEGPDQLNDRDNAQDH
jgi:hypothetical protein